MEILLLIIMLVVFLLITSRLRNDLESLKQKVRQIEGKMIVNKSQHEQPAMPQSTQAQHVESERVQLLSNEDLPRAVDRPSAANVSAGHTWFDEFTDWLKDDWLVKIGAFLIVVAFSFFARYAVVNNWIGEVGRIAITLLIGIGFLIGGAIRLKKYRNQGSIFTIAGSTIITLGVMAGYYFYDLFGGVELPFVMIFLTTVFTSLIGVVYRSKALNILSLLHAVSIPILLTVDLSATLLFTYLLIIVVGTLWVVALTGYSVLTLIAVIIYGLYSMPYISMAALGNKMSLITFAYIFTAIFFIVGILGLLKQKIEDRGKDIFIVVANIALLIFWIMSHVSTEWQSLALIFWAFVFLLSAYGVYRATKDIGPFYLYALAAVVFISTATTIELSGAALVMAYLVEIIALILGSYLVTRKIEYTEKLSILMFGPFFMALASLASSSWMSGLLHEDFAIVLMTVLTTGFLGYAFIELNKDHETTSTFGPIWIVASSILFYALLWQGAHAVLEDKDVAVALSLFVYTVIGLSTYVIGKLKAIDGIKVYGSILLGFVVARLVLVEVWDMELLPRILTFLAIGGLLMGTAFIKKEDTSAKLSEQNHE